MLEQGDDFNLEPIEEKPEKGSGNRTFVIAAGVMAGVVLLTLICMAVYFLVIAPNQQAQIANEQATVEAYNQQMQQSINQTAQAQSWTPTSRASPTAPTVVSTNTPVLAVATETTAPEMDPGTATMAALQTQVAIAQLTPTSLVAGTAFAMPQSGIGDSLNGNIPLMILGAAVLVIVILLARRMRAVPGK